MEEAEKSSSHVQQQQQLQQMLMLQQRQQRQQFLLLQHLQKQQHRAATISRFPSNSDTHLRILEITHHAIQPNPVPEVQHQQHPQQQQLHPPQQQKPGNQLDFQMASYQYACRVCHPDLCHPFSSLEDACER